MGGCEGWGKHRRGKGTGIKHHRSKLGEVEGGREKHGRGLVRVNEARKRGPSVIWAKKGGTRKT